MIHFRPEAAKTSRGRTVMLEGDLVEVIHVRVRRLLRRVRRAQSGPDGVSREAVRAGRPRAKGPRPPRYRGNHSAGRRGFRRSPMGDRVWSIADDGAEYLVHTVRLSAAVWRLDDHRGDDRQGVRGPGRKSVLPRSRCQWRAESPREASIRPAQQSPPRTTSAELASNPAPRSSHSTGNVPRPHPSETGRSCKAARPSR